MLKTDFVPSIIDIEASGFGSHSYPIEVGVVLYNGKRYCSLILPHSSWQHWSVKAEKLHGISRKSLLENGKPITQVCDELNTLLRDHTLYSDAWAHDISWLQRLFEYGGKECAFRLSPIEGIASEWQLEVWDEAKKQVLESYGSAQRHRASYDALLIQQTWERTRSLVDGVSRTAG